MTEIEMGAATVCLQNFITIHLVRLQRRFFCDRIFHGNRQ